MAGIQKAEVQVQAEVEVEGGNQKAEGGNQKAEGREQKAESRKQKAVVLVVLPSTGDTVSSSTSSL